MTRIVNYVKCLLLLLIIFINSAFFQPATECDKELQDIISYYNGMNRDKIHMKFTSYSIVDGEEGDKLVNEVWISHNKVKYENEFFLLFQDFQTQVMIFKASKLIVIKRMSDIKKTSVGYNDLSKLSPSVYLDSLKKVAKNISCSQTDPENKLISISYPDGGADASPLEKVNLFLNIKNHSIKKTEYVFDSSTRKEVYEYNVWNTEVDPKLFEGGPLGKVMTVGTKQLRKEYQGFSVRDLR